MVDDLDGPTVATTGGPPGGAPAPSVRSEVLARTPQPSSPPSTPPRYPSLSSSPPDSMESTQLLRTDERMALAQAHTVLDPTAAPTRRAEAPRQPAPGATPSYVPAPPPRDAAGRSIAPPAVPQGSAPSMPPQPAWMPPRGQTMPMIHEPMPHASAPREPLAPALKVAIGVAAALLAAIWIGSCLLIQSS
jgi:hypothetical protein